MPLTKSGEVCYNKNRRRGVAQLVEHRSPKPRVAGSSPVSPAKAFRI